VHELTRAQAQRIAVRAQLLDARREIAKAGGKILVVPGVVCATFRGSGHRVKGIRMSDQDRTKLSQTDDTSDDVEAHLIGGRDQNSTRGSADDDDGDDVEAHVLGGR
jgi:hypothetical protein